MTVNSLESFLDGYIKNLAIKNEPESFSGYSAATLREINRRKNKSELEALESYALTTRPYGRRNEILSSYGLYDSGYKTYYDALKSSELTDALNTAEEKTRASERDAYKSYLDYLTSETKRQNNLTESVTKNLTENRILDPVEIYKYAVLAGMTKDRAEASITKVYNSVKNTVKREIIERIASNEYNTDLAVAYAKSVGLKDADVDEIKKLAEKVTENFRLYPDYNASVEIEDLEDLGNQTNSSH